MLRPPLSSSLFPYPTLVQAVHHQLSLPADFLTNNPRPPQVVFEIPADLHLEMRPAFRQPLAQKLAQFLVRVTEPSGRGRICRDRKSTRLNSSHANISYAVFC